MKSFLFILVTVFVLAGLALSIGTIFFISADTKVLEKEVISTEAQSL